VSNSHIRDTWLKPLFGVTVAETHRNKRSNLRVRIYPGNVQLGLWKYRCKEREDGRRVYRARASWFRIKAKNVPLYVEHQHDICSDDQPYDPEEMLYGRFLNFAQVETTWDVGQGDQPLIFGYCRLFRRLKLDDESKWNIADLPVIDFMKPLSYFDEAKDRNPAYNGLATQTDIQWVQLKHIDGMVVWDPYMTLTSSQQTA